MTIFLLKELNNTHSLPPPPASVRIKRFVSYWLFGNTEKSNTPYLKFMGVLTNSYYAVCSSAHLKRNNEEHHLN